MDYTLTVCLSSGRQCHWSPIRTMRSLVPDLHLGTSKPVSHARPSCPLKPLTRWPDCLLFTQSHLLFTAFWCIRLTLHLSLSTIFCNRSNPFSVNMQYFRFISCCRERTRITKGRCLTYQAALRAVLYSTVMTIIIIMVYYTEYHEYKN